MTTEFSYRIIRSKRRTMALEINAAGEILVRCPQRCTKAQIEAFVQSRADWLRKHLQKRAAQPKLPPMTMEEVRALAQQALEVIPGRVAHYAPLVGVTYGRITIRNQRSRWGSCSSQGNLNFNCLLMLAPPEVLDYVVVHELCHRREMNHSPRFWALVEQVLPDWRQRRQWLKTHGDALMRRMTQQ